jgi:AraC-like DNA-binding protein
MDGFDLSLYVSDMPEHPYAVHVRNAVFAHCAPGWSWDHTGHQRDTYLLWVVVKGRGTLDARGVVHPVRAGDCFWMRLREPHRGRHQPRTPLTVPWASFELVDERGKTIPWSPELEAALPPLHRRLQDLPFVTRLFQRAIEAFQEGAFRAANHWLGVTLMEATRDDGAPHLSGLQREQAEQVEAFCQRIREAPAHPWRVDDMAGECHYTPDHFTRIFQRIKGVTPREFIVQARLDEAKGLLQLSSYSITRIADMLGYHDVYHFSRQFKQKTGSAPSAYRRGEPG